MTGLETPHRTYQRASTLLSGHSKTDSLVAGGWELVKELQIYVEASHSGVALQQSGLLWSKIAAAEFRNSLWIF